MALEGSLGDFGLADILQLIYFQRKTGVLTLDGNRDKVTLMFLDGSVAGAESRRRVDDSRLGKILVKKGVIKDTDLQAALDEQRKTKAKLGSVLTKLGLVQQNVISEILSGQITDTVIQLFGWKQGTYSFSAQAITPDKDFPLSLDTQHLLMEGLRVVDEWSGAKEKIALEAVFTRSSADASQLTKDDMEVYQLVDGENDVSAVIELSGRESLEVSQALISLRERGFIKLVSAAAVSAAPAEAEAARKPGAMPGYLAVGAIIFSVLLAAGLLLLRQDAGIKIFRTAGRIEELRMNIEVYRVEHGEYPASLDLISRETDPWGRPFVYRLSDKAFTLSSAGPDGKEGTADDIF